MADAYTRQSEESFWQADCEDFLAADILRYLNKPENFREFSDGLRQLLYWHGCDSRPDDVSGQVQFLLEKLTAIPTLAAGDKQASLRKSLRNWLTAANRPDVVESSRERIFDIFFALGCTLEEVTWFQAHVYFDRPFYCRNMKDAVYFFSFYHHYSYDHCQQLLARAAQLVLEPAGAHPIHTRAVREKLEHISGGDEELLRFLQANGSSFSSWEDKAFAVIQKLTQSIRGKKEDRGRLDEYLRDRDPAVLEKTGYVVQEYARLHRTGEREFPDSTITSNDFMLHMILNRPALDKKLSFVPQACLSKLISRNFPNRNVFSAILKGDVKSYEAARKAVILLQFYVCACQEWADPDWEGSYFDDYRIPIDTSLQDAGFDPLFQGNPYDLLFLLAARSEAPLLMLRDIISTACGEN